MTFGDLVREWWSNLSGSDFDPSEIVWDWDLSEVSMRDWSDDE